MAVTFQQLFAKTYNTLRNREQNISRHLWMTLLVQVAQLQHKSSALIHTSQNLQDRSYSSSFPCGLNVLEDLPLAHCQPRCWWGQYLLNGDHKYDWFNTVNVTTYNSLRGTRSDSSTHTSDDQAGSLMTVRNWPGNQQYQLFARTSFIDFVAVKHSIHQLLALWQIQELLIPICHSYHSAYIRNDSLVKQYWWRKWAFSLCQWNSWNELIPMVYFVEISLDPLDPLTHLTHTLLQYWYKTDTIQQSHTMSHLKSPLFRPFPPLFGILVPTPCFVALLPCRPVDRDLEQMPLWRSWSKYNVTRRNVAMALVDEMP